jgi:predicted transcriptional regulator
MSYIKDMAKPAPQQLPEDDPETAALRAVVAEARASLDKGQYIRHEDMRRWLLSWGTENELPPPSEWK